MSELASKSINAYNFPGPIHKYIKNKFLTSTREVGDPILSHNIDLKYVVSKTKQKGEKSEKLPEYVLKPWDRLCQVNVQAEVTHGT